MKFTDAVACCTKCKELAEFRTNVVIGDGPIPCPLVFLGEAPGKQEDLKGIPFIGAAGKHLRTIIQLLKLTPEQFHILNMLKCRPPENRNPLPEELKNCRPFLVHQLQAIRPKVIVAMGKFAQAFVLGTDIKQVHTIDNAGNVVDFSIGNLETKALLTYHPAFVLRKRNTQIEKAFRKNINKGKRVAYAM